MCLCISVFGRWACVFTWTGMSICEHTCVCTSADTCAHRQACVYMRRYVCMWAGMCVYMGKHYMYMDRCMRARTNVYVYGRHVCVQLTWWLLLRSALRTRAHNLPSVVSPAPCLERVPLMPLRPEKSRLSSWSGRQHIGH